MHRDTKDQLLTRLIENPTARASLLDEAHLNSEERKDIIALLDLADLLWEHAHGAPPIENDPVMQRLGMLN